MKVQSGNQSLLIISLFACMTTLDALRLTPKASFAASMQQANTNEHATLAQKLMQQQWTAQFGDAPETCDAQRKCVGQCWAHVNEGPQYSPSIQFEMKVSGRDKYISGAALCEDTTWEMGDVGKLFELLGGAERGTFLDIGANIGSWTLPYAVHKNKSQVVAIEVSSFISGMLQETIEANNLKERVQVHQFAVVQDPTSKEFCMSEYDEESIKDSGNMGGNMVNLGDNPYNPNCAQKVVARTLDSLYESSSELHNVIAAKLDCEGCEGQALLGAANFLSKSPPCILAMEITPLYMCRAGTPVKQLAEFLDQKGYATEKMMRSNTSHLTCDEVQRAGIEQDFIFIEQKDLATCLSKYL